MEDHYLNPMLKISCAKCIYSRTKIILKEEQERNTTVLVKDYAELNITGESPEITAMKPDKNRVLLSCHRHSPGPRLIPLSESSEDNITAWPLVDADDFCGEGETLESLDDKQQEKFG